MVVCLEGLGLARARRRRSVCRHVQLRIHRLCTGRCDPGRGFGATDIILALRVNDWLNATLTKQRTARSSRFYASALHSANLSAAIWALTPPVPRGFVAPNVNGDTLADFRTQATVRSQARQTSRSWTAR